MNKNTILAVFTVLVGMMVHVEAGVTYLPESYKSPSYTAGYY
jgi:hypothetical protein